MKKIVLVVVVVCCMVMVHPAFGQFKMSAGPAIGLNLNLHGGSDLPQSGSGFGFVFAGEADMTFNKSLGLIGSLYFYDGRGGSYSMTNSNVSYDVGASISYFEIEPLLKIQMQTSPIYFVAGPSLGFNLSGQSEVKITTPGYVFQGGGTTQKQTLQNMNSRFELKAGAGYPIPMTGFVVDPRLTFSYGLTNVQENVVWKIMTFQLMVAVTFPVI